LLARTQGECRDESEAQTSVSPVPSDPEYVPAIPPQRRTPEKRYQSRSASPSDFRITFQETIRNPTL